MRLPSGLRLGDARVFACITVAVAAIVQLSPALRSALIFDRDAVAQGDIWRVATASLVHFSWMHLAGDAAVLIPACWLLRERRISEALILVMGASIAGAVFVWQFSPDLRWYGGLSAVDHALVAYAALIALGTRGTGRILAAAALVVLGVKVGVDTVRVRELAGVADRGHVVVATMSHLGAVVFAAVMAAASRLWMLVDHPKRRDRLLRIAGDPHALADT
jgi:rhomboid family GlyGly-CTERM serine protease